MGTMHPRLAITGALVLPKLGVPTPSHAGRGTGVAGCGSLPATPEHRPPLAGGWFMVPFPRQPEVTKCAAQKGSP